MLEFLFLTNTPLHSLSFSSCKTWVVPCTHANHSSLAGVKVLAVGDVSGKEVLGLSEIIVTVWVQCREIH